jgi:hypothetical protein
MFRLLLGLTIQLENECGVPADLNEGWVDVLMTSDAGIGAGIQIAEIAHACGDSISVGIVGARMVAQPAL